jgi:hypothetical protein
MYDNIFENKYDIMIDDLMILITIIIIIILV